MSRVYLAGSSCVLDRLERAQDLLLAAGYDVHISGPGSGLPTEPDTVSDCVDEAAADLDALLSADLIATCLPFGPEPWEVAVGRELGIRIVGLAELTVTRVA